MKERIIQGLAEAARDVACMAWHLGERVHLLVDRLSESAFRTMNTIPALIDPDEAPCEDCGEPGGKCIDCEDPSHGRWTATERRMIEMARAERLERADES